MSLDENLTREILEAMQRAKVLWKSDFDSKTVDIRRVTGDNADIVNLASITPGPGQHQFDDFSYDVQANQVYATLVQGIPGYAEVATYVFERRDGSLVGKRRFCHAIS